jgi:hypothetical protein
MSWIIGPLLSLGLGFVTEISSLETFRPLPPEQQRPAPQFSLPDYQGTPMDLSDLRGKVVVVRFWATW